MRTCKFCNTERPLNEFRTRLQKNGKRIYYHECKPCYNERLRNSEESKKYARDRQRRGRKENPEQYRGYELKKRHKITLETYNKKLEEQGGLCAICGVDAESFTRSLAVDHDHSCCDHDKSCGKCLRGLLCTGCNSGLGSFRDNIDNLKKAIVYLETVKPGEWMYQ